MGGMRTKENAWKEHERAYVIENYACMGANRIAKVLGRTKQSILIFAFRNNLKLSKDANIEVRGRESINQSGELNPNWKGGISKDNYHYKLKSIAKHSEKHKCRKIFESAVKSGQIKRMPCVICGDENSEGHHEDYTKPLDVIFLCRKHHVEADIKRRLKDLPVAPR